MKSATAFYLLPSLSLTPLPLAGSFSVSANSFCSDFMGEINWKERTLGARGNSSARLCLKMISERRDVLHAFLYPSKIRAERVMRGGYFEERLFVEPTMYRHPQLDCDNGTKDLTI